ncbi:hypothetical protein [Acinetobacter rongchengensis]|jgi:hypothetical protein|uniref:Uncharacterized protein n=1 Tax=Acinetobacter rongchengensis TaxID=2419601 RepID=A0A3A8EXY7_9GAMM|nr:hypothetical protein [Acinetobacter rongchengensis]RKG33313.1 hypothetical protein D7V20_18010 [Acinetobacter rongchengensis]
MKLLISTALISTAMIATSTMAQQPLQASTTLNTVELNTIFDASQFENIQATELSNQEMKDTQGAIAPLVAVGIMAGGRFIVQRYVTQSIARSMVQSAGNNAIRQNQIWGVMANTRSQASNIVGRNGIREFHQGAGQRFTHYHTSNRNGAHVWYGSPR